MRQMYEPIIGLEVHLELSTKSKMFCRCSADYFGKNPNTHTCPICLGLPGALPYINKEAVNGCVKIGLALNCQINTKSLFERKNYFYPDLPKGYQISQYRWPLCIKGKLKMDNGKWIRINRVHQEEDTGKLTHVAGETLIDFNRSGVPLVEIVTEPDFHSPSQVKEYAKKLQQIFRYLGVSNADMEKGDMRLEANVSVRKSGDDRLPDYRVELKNINSFRFMAQAIEYEVKRQVEELEQGRTLTYQTRGWDEDRKQTFAQREKEEAHDYRYFPEPDLPALDTKQLEAEVRQFKEEMLELPDEKARRYVSDFGIREDEAKVLVDSQELAAFFEKAAEEGNKKRVEVKEVAKFIINKKVDINKTSVDQVLEEIAGKKSGVIEDGVKLQKMAEEVMAEHPPMVEAYKKGKTAVIQALIGAVMRKSGGKVSVDKLREILEKLLS